MEPELKEVREPNVIFRSISDRDVFKVVNDSTDKTLVEISGYDLQIDFNMEFINSMEDVEMAITGMGNLFRDIILDKLFANKRETEGHAEDESRQ